jgi:iron complex transport system ATP-binding protein
MIAYHGVSVRYPGVTTHAVQDVSFDVPRGRVTALVGPNGSGKSSLVRALLRRVPRTAGQITLDGTDLDQLPPRAVAQRVAVVTQQEETSFVRPVREYIALGRHPHHTQWGQGTDDERFVHAAARLADVEPYLDRRTDELSGGEWQRVRLARALAQRADVDPLDNLPTAATTDTGFALVLDEPTTYLDIAHEMATFELLDRLARTQIAVLLVSHQLNLVARFADHMILLHQGHVVTTGAPEAVMRGDVLERVYAWPLVVTRDPAVNAPTLVPLRRRG